MLCTVSLCGFLALGRPTLPRVAPSLLEIVYLTLFHQIEPSLKCTLMLEQCFQQGICSEASGVGSYPLYSPEVNLQLRLSHPECAPHGQYHSCHTKLYSRGLTTQDRCCLVLQRFRELLLKACVIFAPLSLLTDFVKALRLSPEVVPFGRS